LRRTDVGFAPVTEKDIRLYGIALSHPVLAVRGMLERKGLPYRYVALLGGLHPPSLWALGFRHPTVPAMRLPDGRRVQGSVEIAQALDQLAASPPLYPSDPRARREAEEAERWGERVLQPVPRRLLRWQLLHRSSQRRWFVRAGTPLPAPALTAALMWPLAAIFAAQASADGEQVRRDLAELPNLLDAVDDLIARGVIGGSEPGAADFQIAASVRMLLALGDVRPLVTGRPSAAHALAHVPDYPDVPPGLPADWLPRPARR
jgi:glutathione S-transferase